MVYTDLKQEGISRKQCLEELLENPKLLQNNLHDPDSDPLTEQSASDSDPFEDVLTEKELQELIPANCFKSLKKDLLQASEKEEEKVETLIEPEKQVAKKPRVIKVIGKRDINTDLILNTLKLN